MRHVEAPVVLAAGSVRIRPYRASDADRLSEAVRVSIAELTPWLDWCHEDYSRAESATWIASHPDA